MRTLVQSTTQHHDSPGDCDLKSWGQSTWDISLTQQMSRDPLLPSQVSQCQTSQGTRFRLGSVEGGASSLLRQDEIKAPSGATYPLISHLRCAKSVARVLDFTARIWHAAPAGRSNRVNLVDNMTCHTPMCSQHRSRMSIQLCLCWSCVSQTYPAKQQSTHAV